VRGNDMVTQRIGTVGVVVGLDQPVDLIADPAALQFTRRTSALDPLNPLSGRGRDVSWTSLGDLSSATGVRSDYALLGKLSDPGTPWNARGDSTQPQDAASAYRALQAAAAVDTGGL